METRANFVAVGAFTLLAILAAFGFVYWTAVGAGTATTMLRVKIPGSAAGLSRGSAVLFNGVRVGDITRLYIDPEQPGMAVADTSIDRTTPITPSTRADIGLAGLTGQANIEISGGDLTEPSLFDLAEQQGVVPEITANPSAVTNLLQTAQQILTRADTVLVELEEFVTDSRGPLTDTVNNVRDFSDALGRNAEGIDRFLANFDTLSNSLAGVSVQLDSTLAAAEGLINAIDRDKVTGIVQNIEDFTVSLQTAAGGIDEVMAGVSSAVATINEFSRDAASTIAKVDRMIEGVDPEAIGRSVANIEAFSETARTVADDVSRVTTRIGERSEDIDAFIADARLLGERLSGATERIDAIMGNVDAAAANIAAFSETATGTVSRVDTILQQVSPEDVRTAIASITAASESARVVIDDVSKVTSRFGERSEDIDRMITDAGELAARLNQATVRIDQIMANVDTAVANVSSFSETATGTIGRVDDIIREVNPEDVRAAIASITAASRSAERVVEDVAKVTGPLGARGEDIDSMIANATELAARLNQATVRIDQIMANVDTAVANVSSFSETATGTIGRVDDIIRGVNSEDVRTAIDNITAASASARRVVDDVARVTGPLGERSQDIDRMITDAQQLAERLNAASVRVDGVLEKLDGLLGSGEAEGLMVDASQTLSAFRQVADTLNQRLGTITDGLARFSGQGLRDVEALVRDSRRSISRIEQAITDLERNPQRIITGGEGSVRQFDGRMRR